MKVKAMRDFMLQLGERVWGVVAPRRARGQSLILIAMAFIGLAVMVGLAVDGGILFASQAHLRRAVDAAAVAAATQMRVGQSPEAIQRFAYQFIKMNGVDPTTVIVSLTPACSSVPNTAFGRTVRIWGADSRAAGRYPAWVARL